MTDAPRKRRWPKILAIFAALALLAAWWVDRQLEPTRLASTVLSALGESQGLELTFTRGALRWHLGLARLDRSSDNTGMLRYLFGIESAAQLEALPADSILGRFLRAVNSPPDDGQLAPVQSACGSRNAPRCPPRPLRR